MDYLPRLVDARIDTLLAELPALFLTGPRATGKTTTAARRAATVVRLDREAEAVAFRADPDAALRGLPAPVLALAVSGVTRAVTAALGIWTQAATRSGHSAPRSPLRIP